MIEESAIREMRSRVNIVSVAATMTQLEERQKGDFWGLSPFTAEKTASFHVREDWQYFHCFASGKRGDVYKLLQEYEALTFPQAFEKVKELAGGIEYSVTPEVRKSAQQRKEKTPSVKTNGEEKSVDVRTLEQRGHDMSFLKSTFELVECREDLLGEYWEYPTYLGPQRIARTRRKFRDKTVSKKKYHYSPFDDRPEPCGYPLQYLEECSGEEVWIVNGEPSVWMCYEKGYTAFCALSESNRKRLPELIELLRLNGARVINVLLDNDDVGFHGTSAIAEVAVGLGYSFPKENEPIPNRGFYVVPRFWESGKYKDGYDAADCLFEGGRLEDIPIFQPQINTHLAKQEANEAMRTVQGEPKKGVEIPVPRAELDKLPAAEQVRLATKWLEGNKLLVVDGSEFYIVMDSAGHKRPVVIGSEEFDREVEALAMKNRIWFGDTALKKLKLRLQSIASHHGTRCTTYIRVAEYDGKIYYDLGNKQRDVVEIGPDGWRVLSSDEMAEIPVFLIPSPHTLEQPTPIRIESEEMRKEVWQQFKDLLLPGNEENWVKMVAWAISSMSPPSFPYPGLCINGRQGSGKSVRSKIMKRLVDPSGIDLTNEPKDVAELVSILQGTYLAAFENMSSFSREMSDAFCRVATGASITVRKMYSHTTLSVTTCRPLMVNGITDSIRMPDLRRRFLFVEILPFGKGTVRLKESLLWRDFEKLRPHIMACLFDAVSAGLKHYDDEDIERLDWGEGLVDFGCFVAGAEKAGMLPWKGIGTFQGVYSNDMKRAAEVYCSESQLVRAIIGLIKHLEDTRKNPYWTGDSSMLYKKLSAIAAWETVDIDDILNSTYFDAGGRKPCFGKTEAEDLRRQGLGQYTLREDLDEDSRSRIDERARRSLAGTAWPKSPGGVVQWIKREIGAIETAGIVVEKVDNMWTIYKSGFDPFLEED